MDAGGYRVHLYCTGTGSPAVVVLGAFSVDWGLVQPEVAKTTQICTYDSAGTAWSDPPPVSSFLCQDRVAELHRMLKSGGVPGPYVLVGYSIGGLVARLYAHDYPADVAGMVLVDHAFLPSGSDAPAPPPVAASAADRVKDSPPVLIYSVPIVIGMEDSQNFARLPPANREMHLWAMANHPLRPTAAMAAECSNQVERSTAGNEYPLGDRPLTVVRTAENLPAYERLQKALLALSHNSRMVLAAHSTHMVMIDEPAVAGASIAATVQAVRSRHKLNP